MAKEIEQEEEQIKLEPRVELQTLSPCKIKVTIEVPVEKIRHLVDRKFQKLNESVQIPGFRRGFTPRNLLERKFGKEVLEELKGDLVANAFKEAAEEKKIEAVQEPHVLDVEKLEVKADAPFTYSVEIEVLPTVELKTYTGLKVKKSVEPVSDEQVGAAIEELREEYAEWEPLEAEAQKGDQAIVDLTLSAEGKEIATQENTALILAEQIRMLGTPLPEMHKVFVGQKVGATVEYSVDLPAEFEDPELRGKKATIRGAVKSLKRKRLPELAEEFFKRFDCDTLEELRGEVRKRLQKEKELEARARMQGDLLQQVILAHEVPLPDGLVQAATAEQMRHKALELIQQGAPEEKIREFLAGHQEAATQDVRRSLQQQVLVDQIAKKEKIFVTEDDVQKRIEEMARAMGRSVGEMEGFMESQGMLPSLRRRMRFEKVLELLLDKAQVEE
jgi:trigger factor